MIRTYKYRIYPTNSQITKLENTFSICRALYNSALEHRVTEYERNKRSVNYYEQATALPAIKTLFPWYKSVHAGVLQDVLKRLNDSFQNFFRRLKDDSVKLNEKGYPKFKKRGQWNSITYTDSRRIKYPDNTVTVPKIGDIKILLHRNIPADGILKTMKIIREANNWYVAFSVELSNSSYPELNVNTDKSIGIDLGLIDYYYDSDGNSKKAPRLLRLAENNLKRLQRKLAECKKRSNDYYKTLKALKTAYSKLKYKRQDFFYKTAYELFSSHDLVIVEDLQLKSLIRRAKPKRDENGKYIRNNAVAKSGLNKSFADAGFGKFINILAQVSNKLGKLMVKVPPHYTSQDCSDCGNRLRKSLSTRTHKCNECGLILNRDHNASINILRLGLQSLGANPLKIHGLAL